MEYAGGQPEVLREVEADANKYALLGLMVFSNSFTHALVIFFFLLNLGLPLLAIFSSLAVGWLTLRFDMWLARYLENLLPVVLEDGSTRRRREFRQFVITYLRAVLGVGVAGLPMALTFAYVSSVPLRERAGDGGSGFRQFIADYFEGGPFDDPGLFAIALALGVMDSLPFLAKITLGRIQSRDISQFRRLQDQGEPIIGRSGVDHPTHQRVNTERLEQSAWSAFLSVIGLQQDGTGGGSGDVN